MSSAPAPLEVLPTSTMTEQQAAKGTGTGSSANHAPAAASKSNYKGFVAGVFSGIAKLSGESEIAPGSLSFRDQQLGLLSVQS